MLLRVPQLARNFLALVRGVAMLIVFAVAAPFTAVSSSAAGDDPPIDEQYLDQRLSNDALLSENRQNADAADRQIQVAAGELDALAASATELESRIAALESEIVVAEADYEVAFEEQAQTIRESAATRAEVDDTRLELEAWESIAKERAIAAYVSPVRTPAFIPYLESESMTELQRKMVLLSAIAEGDAELIAGLRETRATLDDQLADLDYREAKATDGRKRLNDALDVLGSKRLEQDELQRELDEKIAAQVAEIEALEAARAELQRIIATREARFVAEAAQRAQWREQCAQGIVPTNEGGAPVDCGGLDDPLPPSSMTWPSAGIVTSEFGERWGRMHEGIDVAAGEGTPLWAAEDGVVFFAGWLGGYGNATIIDHGGGVMSLYGHQASIYVIDGQNVVRGESIGAMGSTGNSTGPHVHFETIVNGSPVNPRQFLG